MAKKPIKLDIPPEIIGEVKETTKERLIRLYSYLAEEVRVFGNTYYSQDLRLSIKRLEGK